MGFCDRLLSGLDCQAGQERLGVEAQRQAVAGYLNGGNWKIVGEFTEVMISAIAHGLNRDAEGHRLLDCRGADIPRSRRLAGVREGDRQGLRDHRQTKDMRCFIEKHLRLPRRRPASKPVCW
jgi:hypothetical protein